MPSTPELVVRRLISRLKQRAFKEGSNNAKLLDLYLSKFPGGATNEDASKALGLNPNTPIYRLRADLEQCFAADRSLWREQQMLDLSDTEPDHTNKLYLRPLHTALSTSMKVWFHQCIQIPMPRKKEDRQYKEEPQPFIVMSEPLFFFSNSSGTGVDFAGQNPPNDLT